MLSFDNHLQNVNGKLPFFLWIPKPFYDFVSVYVLVFNDFFEFDDGVADALDEFCYFCWVLKLVFDDVSDQSLELVFSVVDFVVTVNNDQTW